MESVLENTPRASYFFSSKANPKILFYDFIFTIATFQTIAPCISPLTFSPK